ncbi:hypothetical protein J437_LFUL011384 [Ladona fulva]|uniref:Uncharacterized protein n=1 Tax=Ladona fulva TaxID=123851 RepID=A0A8K0KDW8_LADFU|nr:hypothetical protein J437_LFUL011384 [Ladona fulva]
MDPNFVENEEKYQALKKVIVGDFSDASGSENEGSDEEDDEEGDDEEDNEKEGEGMKFNVCSLFIAEIFLIIYNLFPG